MDARTRKRHAESILAAHAKRRRFPAVLFWRVTERQVIRARYRPPPNAAADELSTFQIREIIDQAAKLGVLKINFYAEDPVLRDDIDEIAAHARAKGIFVEVAASGPLLSTKASQLVRAARIMIPLLGRRPVHEELRVGRSVYDQATEGVSAARKLGLPTTLLFTATNRNVEEIEYVLQLASKVGAMVCLEALPTETHTFVGVEKFYPTPEAFRSITDLLLGIYKKRHDMIRNSRESLEYLAHWPK
ncbi:MAG: radical SAM protein, partial [Candidatus Methylomirabilis sp.]|nr:radical SAM protein [Deltaproteobacteria bacterium]